jgi:hypothetical protein
MVTHGVMMFLLSEHTKDYFCTIEVAELRNLMYTGQLEVCTSFDIANVAKVVAEWKKNQ